MSNTLKKSQIEEMKENIASSMVSFTSTKLMSDGTLKVYKLDAEGAGQRFADEHAHEARHVTDWDCWIVWDGKRWKKDTSGSHAVPGKLVRRLASLTAEGIKAEIGLATNLPVKKQRTTFWQTYQSTNGKLSMLAEAAQLPSVSIMSKELDQHPEFLVVGNGTVNLRTGVLGKHDPAHLMTRMTPVKYHANARGRQWVDFKGEKYPTPIFLDWMMRLWGYIATGYTSEKKFFIGAGGSGGGKTTQQDALARALGEYVTSGNVEMVVQKPFDDMTNKGLANHQHSRFVYISESKQGVSLDVEKVKKCTFSGEIVTAPKYVQEFSYTPHFKMWMFTNHLPKIDFADDDAAWERLRVIPYPVLRNSLNGKAADRSWTDRMLANPKELEAILADVVRGAGEWFKRGLDVDVPIEVMKETSAYQAASGSFFGFIGENFIKGPKLWITSSKFRELYAAYCAANGVSQLQGKALKAQMEKINCRSDRETTKEKRHIWRGIGLSGAEEVAPLVDVMGWASSGEITEEDYLAEKSLQEAEAIASAEEDARIGTAEEAVEEMDPWAGYEPDTELDEHATIVCGFRSVTKKQLEKALVAVSRLHEADTPSES